MVWVPFVLGRAIGPGLKSILLVDYRRDDPEKVANGGKVKRNSALAHEMHYASQTDLKNQKGSLFLGALRWYGSGSHGSIRT
jgi:hypothetical protein